MKKRNRVMAKIIASIVSAMLLLLSGALALEIGQQAKAVVLIMCSLYVAIWTHAGIVSTLINAKFKTQQKERTGVES